MIEFFNMGGYGLYVWSVVLIHAVMIFGLVLAPHLRHKNLTKSIRNRLLAESRSHQED